MEICLNAIWHVWMLNWVYFGDVFWLLAVVDRKRLFGCGKAEKTDEGGDESQGNGSLKIV